MIVIGDATTASAVRAAAADGTVTGFFSAGAAITGMALIGINRATAVEFAGATGDGAAIGLDRAASGTMPGVGTWATIGAGGGANGLAWPAGKGDNGEGAELATMGDVICADRSGAAATLELAGLSSSCSTAASLRRAGLRMMEFLTGRAAGLTCGKTLPPVGKLPPGVAGSAIGSDRLGAAGLAGSVDG